MKRISIFLSIFVVAITAGVVWYSSARAENAPMTEAHIERIRANCVEAQSTLGQLHASDALLRVNRGQLYESISTKLMAPLNSRASLNRLNSVNLVSIATNYEGQLVYFRQSYKQYEEAMSQALKINCMNQPVVFYDSVADVRTKRKKVHESTVALHDTIREYKNEFEVFAKQFEGDSE
jgi:uncharacterized protein YpmB